MIDLFRKENFKKISENYLSKQFELKDKHLKNYIKVYCRKERYKWIFELKAWNITNYVKVYHSTRFNVKLLEDFLNEAIHKNYGKHVIFNRIFNKPKDSRY